MNKQYIVVSGVGQGSKMKFHVVSPTYDQCDGKWIGTLFVAGRIIDEYEALHEAVDAIRGL